MVFNNFFNNFRKYPKIFTHAGQTLSTCRLLHLVNYGSFFIVTINLKHKFLYSIFLYHAGAITVSYSSYCVAGPNWRGSCFHCGNNFPLV